LLGSQEAEAVGCRPGSGHSDAKAPFGGELVSPSPKRAAVVELRTKFDVSERRASTGDDQPRSSQRFEAKPRTAEVPLVKRMLQLARSKPRYEYRRIGWLLREEGWRAGLSRVFCLWQREGLKALGKKRKKCRLGSRANGCHRRRSEAPNDVRCWDFVFDKTASGSQLKWLSVVDECTRECLALTASPLKELSLVRLPCQGVPPRE
jgi:hypothetical protein